MLARFWSPKLEIDLKEALNTRDPLELQAGFPKTAEELFNYQALVLDDLEAVTRGLPPQRLQIAQPELITRYMTNTIKKVQR